jgi:hypothetical protein
MYFSCASSTWSLPSRVSARCAKMSRMSCVRSSTLRSVTAAMDVAWAGARSRSKISTSASRCRARSTTSSSLPRPSTKRGSMWSRTWVTASTTSTPAVRASSRSSRRESSTCHARFLSDTCTSTARPSLATTGRAWRTRANSSSRARMVAPEVDVEAVKGNGALGAPGLAVGVFGQEVRPVHVAGGAVGAGVNGGHEVEAQAREVDEVVVGEGLAAEVGVHEAQATETARGGAEAADVGQHQLVGVADDDMLDGPGAVHEYAHLAPRGGRRLCEGARQLRRRNPIGGNPAAKDALQCAALAGAQACGVAGELDGAPPLRGRLSRSMRDGGRDFKNGARRRHRARAAAGARGRAGAHPHASRRRAGRADGAPPACRPAAPRAPRRRRARAMGPPPRPGRGARGRCDGAVEVDGEQAARRRGDALRGHLHHLSRVQVMHRLGAQEEVDAACRAEGAEVEGVAGLEAYGAAVAVGRARPGGDVAGVAVAAGHVEATAPRRVPGQPTREAPGARGEVVQPRVGLVAEGLVHAARPRRIRAERHVDPVQPEHRRGLQHLGEIVAVEQLDGLAAQPRVEAVGRA